MQNKDSIRNTIFIGLGLCLICAAVISFIAVGLKQLQKQNIILDQQKKIVAAANLEDFYGSVSDAYNSIEEIIISLSIDFSKATASAILNSSSLSALLFNIF